MLLVADKVLQNQEMAARTKVTLLMKAFALERRVYPVIRKNHIPPDLVVEAISAHRKPPEVRICRLSI
jgi:hypothetical protein